MDYLSFGKIAVKPDQAEAFVKEGKAKGLAIKHVQANIYEFGIQLPTLMDQEHLRKTAGLLGLKYSQD
ncbi:hypothetical protein MTBPR1_120107 [Candidatus Terasakiella magnetica]|uniref:Uncharacterized protein n=1 Tax=Candidatus Terasakiella magnetica TaxID=1867952 RepID=A0A1C3REW4_9PROT|nr:hypothetical protein [Candidatus Terasakiella magnetica]SCA55801.1 hypothetical protein MTBPR1_120107 [Candidatus Terasakiella magnetica]